MINVNGYFRTIINKLFEESFYDKRKKKLMLW